MCELLEGRPTSLINVPVSHNRNSTFTLKEPYETTILRLFSGLRF